MGRAVNAGVVVVVAAGNDGDSTDSSDEPNNPDIFAVNVRQGGTGSVIIAGSVNRGELFSAFSTTVLDGYQRAYQVDLALNARSAPVYPQMASALTSVGRSTTLGLTRWHSASGKAPLVC